MNLKAKTRLLVALVALSGGPILTGDAWAGPVAADRSGWAWGVHGGMGTGQIEDGDENQPRRFGMSLGGWLGYGLSQDWVLRSDLRVWRRMSSGNKMLLAEPTLGAAFYPGGRPFFFQAGVGAGYAALEPWDAGTERVWAWGPDLFFGMGYEFPLSPSSAFSVHLDASYVHLGRVDEDAVKLRRVGVNYTDLVFTYNWY